MTDQGRSGRLSARQLTSTGGALGASIQAFRMLAQELITIEQHVTLGAGKRYRVRSGACQPAETSWPIAIGSLTRSGRVAWRRSIERTTQRLAREVAIKVLLPNLAADQAVATRFEGEARTLAAFAHPGVVGVFDVDPGDPTSGREPFFVMEHCPGGSLAERTASGGRLAPDELVPILVRWPTASPASMPGVSSTATSSRRTSSSRPTPAKLADFGLARSDDAAGATTLRRPAPSPERWPTSHRRSSPVSRLPHRPMSMPWASPRSWD